MSRSRKRIAIWKQRNDRYFKRLSNRIIRHTDIASGGAFRRVINTWDICDWAWFPKDNKDIALSLRK